MTRTSLPLTLQLALKQHVKACDIHEDDELRAIIGKLSELNEKIEQVKAKAIANRRKRP